MKFYRCGERCGAASGCAWDSSGVPDRGGRGGGGESSSQYLGSKFQLPSSFLEDDRTNIFFIYVFQIVINPWSHFNAMSSWSLSIKRNVDSNCLAHSVFGARRTCSIKYILSIRLRPLERGTVTAIIVKDLSRNSPSGVSSSSLALPLCTGKSPSRRAECGRVDWEVLATILTSTV